MRESITSGRLTVEVTVYVGSAWRGKGVGRALYGPLIETLRQQGFRSAIAATDSTGSTSAVCFEWELCCLLRLITQGQQSTFGQCGLRICASLVVAELHLEHTGRQNFYDCADLSPR